MTSYCIGSCKSAQMCSLARYLTAWVHSREGAQWLSGRVLDSRPRGHRFEPHRRYCAVSLSESINPSLVLVQHRKTGPFITERLLMGCKESNQINNKDSLDLLVNGSSCQIMKPVAPLDSCTCIFYPLPQREAF